MRQLLLHGEELQARPRARLELHEHVNVAVRGEIVPKNRSEQRQPADAVPPAEFGEVFAAETGFLLQRNPDTVRAADISFVSHERLRDLADYPGFLPLAPDLVAEVVSPNDESSKVEAKTTAWLQAGVRLVLVVDPQTRSIREYRAPDSIRVYRNGAIDLGDILPDFELDVLDLFT